MRHTNFTYITKYREILPQRTQRKEHKDRKALIVCLFFLCALCAFLAFFAVKFNVILTIILAETSVAASFGLPDITDFRTNY